MYSRNIHWFVHRFFPRPLRVTGNVIAVYAADVLCQRSTRPPLDSCEWWVMVNCQQIGLLIVVCVCAILSVSSIRAPAGGQLREGEVLPIRTVWLCENQPLYTGNNAQASLGAAKDGHQNGQYIYRRTSLLYSLFWDLSAMCCVS